MKKRIFIKKLRFIDLSLKIAHFIQIKFFINPKKRKNFKKLTY